MTIENNRQVRVNDGVTFVVIFHIDEIVKFKSGGMKLKLEFIISSHLIIYNSMCVHVHLVSTFYCEYKTFIVRQRVGKTQTSTTFLQIKIRPLHCDVMTYVKPTKNLSSADCGLLHGTDLAIFVV